MVKMLIHLRVEDSLGKYNWDATTKAVTQDELDTLIERAVKGLIDYFSKPYGRDLLGNAEETFLQISGCRGNKNLKYRISCMSVKYATNPAEVLNQTFQLVLYTIFKEGVCDVH